METRRKTITQMRAMKKTQMKKMMLKKTTESLWWERRQKSAMQLKTSLMNIIQIIWRFWTVDT